MVGVLLSLDMLIIKFRFTFKTLFQHSNLQTLERKLETTRREIEELRVVCNSLTRKYHINMKSVRLYYQFLESPDQMLAIKPSMHVLPFLN